MKAQICRQLMRMLNVGLALVITASFLEGRANAGSGISAASRTARFGPSNIGRAPTTEERLARLAAKQEDLELRIAELESCACSTSPLSSIGGGLSSAIDYLNAGLAREAGVRLACFLICLDEHCADSDAQCQDHYSYTCESECS